MPCWAQITIVNAIVTTAGQSSVAKALDLGSLPAGYAAGTFSSSWAMSSLPRLSACRLTLGVKYLTRSGQSAQAVLVSDLTSLRDRDPLQFCLYLPWLVASPRCSGVITEGISAYITDGWRCGCGVFCIVLLVLSAPVIGTMFWGDRRAKEHGGASSVRSSDLAAELILIIRSATDNPYSHSHAGSYACVLGSSSVPHCRPHRPPRAVDLCV